MGFIGLVLSVACQGDGTSPDPKPGLAIAGPTSVSDTILKDIVIRVDLRDDQKRPIEKALVTFEPGIGLQVVGARPNQSETRLTDTNGRVIFQLAIGCDVGSYSSTITSGAHSQRFQVTISPGQRAGVKLTPADTAIYVGASYELDAHMTDQCGNRRPEPVRFTGSSAVATVDASNRVRALSIGRTEFSAEALGRTFRAAVSVPPVGRMAASEYVSSQGEAVPITIGFDGSDRRIMGGPVAPAFYVESTQIPGSQGIVFAAGTHNTKLYIAEDGKAVRPLFNDSRLYAVTGPAVMPDRSWVYFSAHEVAGQVEQTLWRVRLNGSDLQKVALNGPTGPLYLLSNLFPAISPDGTKLVFQLRLRDLETELAILDLATFVITRTGVLGEGPRWSPDGQRIAYVHERKIWIMRPDGSERRQVPTTHQYWSRSNGRPIGLDWSPGGGSVIAQRDLSFIDIVDIATGTAIPLPFTHSNSMVVGTSSVPVWLK